MLKELLKKDRQSEFDENEKKIFKKYRKHYRNVFLTSSGKEVLSHMLTELGFFEQTVGTEATRALHDYGKRILQMLGIWQIENIDSIIEMLLKVPVKEE